MHPSLRAASLVTALLAPAVLRGQTGDSGAPPLLPDWIARFEADREVLEQRFSLEGDARRERLVRFLDAARGELRDMPFEALSTRDRVDVHLVGQWIGRRLRDLEEGAPVLAEARPLLPFHGAIEALAATVRESDPFRPEETAKELSEALRLTEPLLAMEPPAAESGPSEGGGVAAAESGPASRAETAGDARPALASPRAVKKAMEVAAADRAFLERFLEGEVPFDPDLRFWIEAPARRLAGQLRDLETRLRDHVLPAIQKSRGHAFVRGAERLARDLRDEWIALLPEDLLRFGEDQMAATGREIEAAAAEVAPGRSSREALEIVKADHARPGGQRLEVAALAREAMRFASEKRLFRLPPAAVECWTLEPISTERQKLYPFAYYGDFSMGVAYATGDMDHDRKLMAMRGNNRHFTRTVTPHELIPGHHLQRWYRDRNHTERRSFGSSFLVEGWGFYSELLYAENGFFRDARERLGHLFWKRLRAARIVLSMRFHLGRMTAAEAVDYLVAEVGLERSNAEAEVDRYMTFSPLYQASYMYGARQILDLREEWQRARGAGADLADFHEAVLAEGSLPVALLRYPVLGLPVPRSLP